MRTRTSLGETMSYAGSTVGMLRAFGINDTQATMGASGMFWTVGGSNVHAPVTQVLVRAVQRALTHLGEPILVDGLMSQPTQQALLRQVGPRFPQMTWAGVFAVLRDKLANINGDFILNAEPELMPVSGLLDGGIGVGALLGLGLLGYLILGRKKGRR